MNRRANALAPLALAILALALLSAPAAQATFGTTDFDVRYSEKDGSPARQAGSHPYKITGSFNLNYSEAEFGKPYVDGQIKDVFVELAEGLTGNTTAVPRCDTLDFTANRCPLNTVIGINVARLGPTEVARDPLYNLAPPPGSAFRFGFLAERLVPLVGDLAAMDTPPFRLRLSSRNAPQAITVFGDVAELWGVPGDPSHDFARGSICIESAWGGSGVPKYKDSVKDGELVLKEGGPTCPTSTPPTPLLTLPTACKGPLATNYALRSWENPTAALFEGSVLSHDYAIPPSPAGFTGCEKLGFAPRVESLATTDSVETGTGLDFNVDFTDEGLANPTGLTQSQTDRAVVVLPPGMTINPSVAEGLGVCTPADLARETLSAEPGEGCPDSSKVGSLHVDLPIIDQPVKGSIFLAQEDDRTTPQPGAENPFDSLIALYFVLKNAELGVLAKLPVKVEPDPNTGQLVVRLKDVPQYPFSHFNAHIREGQRAPLTTPSACGTYSTLTKLYPSSDPEHPRTLESSFTVNRGIGGGPCPPGGIPPFHPHFEAGALNNNAGSFSPFNMRLIRADGEQDMTKFSAVLPPGELGSLKGVGKCPDAAIAIARSKTGRQELADPSCPANSLIGHTLAGAGVGSALTYVKGQIYLGGPYHGDPLSVISVTPAIAGPFDADTVVVRLALTLNPKTAEVEVDGAASDPIPHILKGIVLKVRDLRVYVDRPNFTLNPTSCDESSARARLFGSYLNVLDPADDVPVGLSTRFQAANCLNLGFKPKLDLTLKGGSKRGGHPGLIASYEPKPRDANVKGLVVRLPRSAFLDQAHIKTICTRVQFAAKACPKGAQYGYIKAWTPLLDEPLQGPVWLRSSNHKLPDLVFDLHGLVDVEVATRIDSANGGIRATVEDAPDAPLTKVELRMRGAKKGLIINSRNLCGHVSKANVQFSGHNGRQFASHPVMRADCGGKRKRR